MDAMPPQRILILDFDGTITTRDADVVIAEAVLSSQERGFIDQLIADYEALELTTAEYFGRYLARLQLSPDQFASHAHQVELRPGLGELLAWCEAERIRVLVASEGLDIYIAPILAAAGASGVDLHCNVARWDGARYHLSPAPDGESCERCVTCKGALVRRLLSEGHHVTLVGNGASDLCGARHAHQTLARDSLAIHCQRESIRHTPWTTFADVRDALA